MPQFNTAAGPEKKSHIMKRRKLYVHNYSVDSSFTYKEVD